MMQSHGPYFAGRTAIDSRCASGIERAVATRAVILLTQ